MTKVFTKTGQLFAIGVLAVALFFACSLVAEAQQKAAPATKKGETKAPTPAPVTTGGSAEEYSGCSPDYSAEEIKAMEEFVADLAPDLVSKLKPILLKCDFKVNDELLNFITALQEEMADMEFDNDEQEKEYRLEKSRELAVHIALSQQPVDQAELKKLVGELFDIRQKTLKADLADLEKQVEMLKKRIAEREQLKDKIIDQKMKDLAAGAQAETEGKEPPTDPLAWD